MAPDCGRVALWWPPPRVRVSPEGASPPLVGPQKSPPHLHPQGEDVPTRSPQHPPPTTSTSWHPRARRPGDAQRVPTVFLTWEVGGLEGPHGGLHPKPWCPWGVPPVPTTHRPMTTLSPHVLDLRPGGIRGCRGCPSPGTRLSPRYPQPRAMLSPWHPLTATRVSPCPGTGCPSGHGCTQAAPSPGRRWVPPCPLWMLVTLGGSVPPLLPSLTSRRCSAPPGAPQTPAGTPPNTSALPSWRSASPRSPGGSLASSCGRTPLRNYLSEL